ncbi:hypothetical protein H6802_03830 [Candidatus Nomurabacteria bacterium]|uniref:Uncharacterized protein n=1 Tax=candidate division WWE3 bacterium TaxID=2053526 RepID=A0A955E215_UNCKA|nr:hypothetical protein [candidate division WWE3 bacterium]MCB9824052.1 hypothetical protein [Candidatus Nomurabacteria bacterium]MCB9826977.1 hypothetical protein [Candidatus Nomurabacteria bacterium]MCB9827993.1 hypothetical protein [Candidatus Nomurabacteria bacterium]
MNIFYQKVTNNDINRPLAKTCLNIQKRALEIQELFISADDGKQKFGAQESMSSAVNILSKYFYVSTYFIFCSIELL